MACCSFDNAALSSAAPARVRASAGVSRCPAGAASFAARACSASGRGLPDMAVDAAAEEVAGRVGGGAADEALCEERGDAGPAPACKAALAISPPGAARVATFALAGAVPGRGDCGASDAPFGDVAAIRLRRAGWLAVLLSAEGVTRPLRFCVVPLAAGISREGPRLPPPPRGDSALPPGALHGMASCLRCRCSSSHVRSHLLI